MESIWRLIKNVEEWREEKLWDIIKLEKKTWRRAKEWTIKNEKHIYKFFTSWEYNNLYTDKYDFDWEYLIIWDWGAANINYVNWKFWVSWHNFVFSSKKENWKNIIDNKFLYYYLYFSKEEWNNLYTWIWIKNISKTDLKEIPVLVPYKNWKPDLETQQKIADFLNECFDKLNNADKYLQLIFQSANQKRWWWDVIDKDFLNANFEEILKKHDEKIAKLDIFKKDQQKRNFEKTVMKWNLIDNLWKSILEGVFNESYLKKKFNWVEWREEKLWDIIDNQKRKKYKFDVLKESEILNSWRYPVISQWDNYINWYSMNEEKLFKWEFPLLAFWDHTFNIKYIDFEFIPSWDWLKILYFIKNINYKYVYYFIYRQKWKIEWYQRHFKILKSLKIPIPYKNWKPDLETQQEIVDILDEAFIYYQRMKNKAESSQEYLQTLRKWILTNIFETANLLSNQK